MIFSSLNSSNKHNFFKFGKYAFYFKYEFESKATFYPLQHEHGIFHLSIHSTGVVLESLHSRY